MLTLKKLREDLNNNLSKFHKKGKLSVKMQEKKLNSLLALKNSPNSFKAKHHTGNNRLTEY